MTIDGEVVVASGANIDPYVARAISTLGEASAKAQGLTSAITVVGKLPSSGDRVYLFRQGLDKNFVGFLRVGKRKLFLYDADTKLHEMQPLCCLDFYVSESMQRCGVGYKLFDRMLELENVSSPSQIAYDKPSPKLLAFLSKHFGLQKPIAQTNKFVIYLDFFPTAPGDPKLSKLLQQCQLPRKVHTHHDSTGVASLLSSRSEESKPHSATKKSGIFQVDRIPSSTTSMPPGKVSDVLRNAQYYKQEDIEALRLSEESLSQINKKIEEREATIARIEKELQAFEMVNEDLHFGRPGKDGFSKSELIRQVHAKKPTNL